jgi:hypothetical protein
MNKRYTQSDPRTAEAGQIGLTSAQNRFHAERNKLQIAKLESSLHQRHVKVFESKGLGTTNEPPGATHNGGSAPETLDRIPQKTRLL